MTQKEIKEKVLALYAENNELISQGTFVLNTKIAENSKEIRRLQEQCKHKYKDGYCIYCLSQKGD